LGAAKLTKPGKYFASNVRGHPMGQDAIRYISVSDAKTGQTIYVNPNAVRYVMAAGHRTVLVFSETHAVTVTSDLNSVMASGLFTA
jgi:hypothetical protein